MHIITDVKKYSIAWEMGICPGDKLISINGRKIADVLDYRFLIHDEELVVEVEKAASKPAPSIEGENREHEPQEPNESEIWELEIEKDAEDDLGLVFEPELMDSVRTCHNHCIFCFMDQMPSGMRKSLYFKDDDFRLSFLSGNYVTLTNMTTEEAERIARYHLSPLHISIHAADPALRRKMLNLPAEAGDLFRFLRIFNGAGITMHFQIVLCKGVNDGPALDHTIGALLELDLVSGSSLSIVPVGITKHRQGLFPLEPFSGEEARAVIEQVEKWQKQAKKRQKQRKQIHKCQTENSFVYCADEWYIKAGIPMPPYEHYGDFPQLENGVGMWALLERNKDEFFDGIFRKIADRISEPDFELFHRNNAIANNVLIDNATAKNAIANIGIVTGEASFDLMRKLTEEMSIIVNHHKVYKVRNDFFGHTITVSGLLTGQDIIAQLSEKVRVDKCSGLLLPGNMFRSGTESTLDDMTRDIIEQKLGLPVWIGDVIM